MKTNIEAQTRRGVEGIGSGSKIYRWNEDPELTEDDHNDPNTILLGLKNFQEGSNRTHGFFSTMPPEEILQLITQKMVD